MLNKFQEVQLLLDRSDEHLKWLREWVVHPEPNLNPAKEGYSVLEASFDLITGKIRLVIGEFASCLRNALNYLTCAVAEQDCGTIGNQVQLPIESSRAGFAGHRNSYLKGVADEHLAFFHTLQPYNAPDSDWLPLLRDLSNWYRHKGLIRVEKVFQRPRVATVSTKTERIGNFTVEMRVDISFGVTLEGGHPVIKTLEQIRGRTQQTVVEFKRPLERYISEHVEDFV